MLAASQKEFIEYFRDIEDPREDERLLYPLSEILFLVFVGILCGAESWRELILFGEERINFLREYFDYENGLPTKSSLSRIFSLIDKKCIESWLENVALRMVKGSVKNEQIAIDGKSLRGKQKLESNSQGSHVVNMFATKLGMVLCQKTVPNKGNELAAIKEMLSNANIEDATISIDAVACYKDVANLITQKKGNYFLALKKNQISLYNDIESLFKEKNEYFDIHETNDKGHGRIETRSCSSTSDIEEIKVKYPEWSGLKSVCQVISSRELKGKISIQERYYLSSEKANAEKQLGYCRNHWAIENNLHWSLDVVFKEDSSSIRKNYAAENISAIRKMVINTIKKYKQKTGNKNGVNIIRKSAGWDSSMHTIREILESWLHA